MSAVTGEPIKLLLGDSLERLRELDANSIDACVCDPPYGLAFMNKKWDYDVPSVELWRQVFRVMKPGAHLLSFGGTRTYHRMVCAIEDAGFEIRDQVQWIYGSGFPKSLDVSKAIDKQAGATREVVGQFQYRPNDYEQDSTVTMKVKSGGIGDKQTFDITAPATPDAIAWQGWGTALKPANEPIVLARKPLERGLTVAQNVLKWGTGAINVDASRIATDASDPNIRVNETKGRGYQSEYVGGKVETIDRSHHGPPAQGRWPANLLFDEEAAAALDEQTAGTRASKPSNTGGKFNATGAFPIESEPVRHDDSGGASRFFYVAKASKSERNRGLEGMPEKASPKFDGGDFERGNGNNAKDQKSQNFHPTVKPIRLMEYLVRMITPPGGRVLDPFMGSGTTGVACARLGFDFIGIEREAQYLEIARKRIEHARRTPEQGELGA